MINHTSVGIDGLVVHRVGNRQREEEFSISKKALDPNAIDREILLKYFVSPFKSEEMYRLHHESDVQLNEVYAYVSKMFEEGGNFYEQSVNLARHLYNVSDHPRIKDGEFYVIYFRDMVLDDEITDAVGLFKSETRDTYLKMLNRDDTFEIVPEEGINISKLDKGCLIFNTEKVEGYLAMVIDNTNTSEAQYWRDAFLRLKSRKDNFHHTKTIINICKDFITSQPDEELDRGNKAQLLNKSLQYFKEKDSFDMEDFSNEVIREPALAVAFTEHKKAYEEQHDVAVADSFDISPQAVKKQQRTMRSVLKLDKNFHVYVHGDQKLIEKGFDEETGMAYYKLYFREES